MRMLEKGCSLELDFPAGTDLSSLWMLGASMSSQGRMEGSKGKLPGAKMSSTVPGTGLGRHKVNTVLQEWSILAITEQNHIGLSQFPEQCPL